MDQKLDSMALFTINKKKCGFECYTNNYIKSNIMGNKPKLLAVLNTHLGKIGIMLIPVLYEEVYCDQELELHLRTAIDVARYHYHSKFISLTGLIPSATNYGQKIILTMQEQTECFLTTGHAATASAMVLNIQGALDRAYRKLSDEIIAFVGLGSIGSATLSLMLSVLPHPSKIYLCDVPSRIDRLHKIQQYIKEHLQYKGIVDVVSSDKKRDIVMYKDSTLIIGATNCPNIITPNLLRSGTIIIDDSMPSVVDFTLCMDRWQKQSDLLVLYGGKLLLPQKIDFTYTNDRMFLEFKQYFYNWHNIMPYEIMGCTISSILPLHISSLKPTLGSVSLDQSIAYYHGIQSLDIKASTLQYQTHFYDETSIKRFSNLCLQR